MLGQILVTKQTGPQGKVVSKVSFLMYARAELFRYRWGQLSPVTPTSHPKIIELLHLFYNFDRIRTPNLPKALWPLT